MTEAARREEWRPIPGREGVYEASSEGRVRPLDRIYVRSDGPRQGLGGASSRPLSWVRATRP
ncbi:hypothetical protein DMA15_26640 [Streptomyces sp. WAC 01529]|nr:hypothetical protein DMA15_26640 [Streptomyces sp. WAC 01529]